MYFSAAVNYQTIHQNISVVFSQPAMCLSKLQLSPNHSITASPSKSIFKSKTLEKLLRQIASRPTFSASSFAGLQSTLFLIRYWQNMALCDSNRAALGSFVSSAFLCMDRPSSWFMWTNNISVNSCNFTSISISHTCYLMQSHWYSTVYSRNEEWGRWKRVGLCWKDDGRANKQEWKEKSGRRREGVTWWLWVKCVREGVAARVHWSVKPTWHLEEGVCITLPQEEHISSSLPRVFSRSKGLKHATAKIRILLHTDHEIRSFFRNYSISTNSKSTSHLLQQQ